MASTSTDASATTAAPSAATTTGTSGAAVEHPSLVVTHTAPTNIAVIKYWGKRDTKLNLPINSSVSVTLNQDDLRATTTVVASRSFAADRLWLNQKEEAITNPRVQAVLREVRARANDKVADDGTVVVAKADWPAYHFHIISENNFPTAAGLASSAAGYACLVSALSDLCSLKETYPGELSTIARQGSGSSCRSLYGGFVKWVMGAAEDGSDSKAVQVADEAHWPDLRALILVVSDKKKETGSTVGMTTSVKTSKLLGHRAAEVVEPRLAAIEAAYRERDFETFGRITMQDSNQFHACCMDTYPPIFYMNDVSKRIIGFVHRMNASAGRMLAAYTFDAGPNAVLYLREADVPLVLSLVLKAFPPTGAGKPVSDPKMEAAARALPISDDFAWVRDSEPVLGVQHVYYTSVGDGPRTLPLAESLGDPTTGFPKYLGPAAGAGTGAGAGAGAGAATATTATSEADASGVTVEAVALEDMSLEALVGNLVTQIQTSDWLDKNPPTGERIFPTEPAPPADE